ncbi:aspartate carbamoyltransferase [Candidatus Peregrinibacteria bacterium]|nr:aspartate carbamoyltransferase [Candidatus Peregrinibacteria bacterium]
MTLSFEHLVSIEQLSRRDADILLKEAEQMEGILKKGGDDRLHGKILANLFYEPSTRTHLSFATAMYRLGGRVISTESVQFSSLYKGESIEDTIRVVGQYADIICMRHAEVGSAARGALVSPIPFINAGDGRGQHPTQALLDLVTIRKERSGIDGIHLAMVGDLKNGRTVHSLSLLLSLYTGVRLTLISPRELRMPAEICDALRERGVIFEEREKMEDALSADVLYMTRIQKERFSDEKEYQRLKGIYVLCARDLIKKNITVMHPLPRVGEISLDVDPLPNAAYFRQVRNGVTVRMALLAMMLGKA